MLSGGPASRTVRAWAALARSTPAWPPRPAELFLLSLLHDDHCSHPLYASFFLPSFFSVSFLSLSRSVNPSSSSFTLLPLLDCLVISSLFFFLPSNSFRLSFSPVLCLTQERTVRHEYPDSLCMRSPMCVYTRSLPAIAGKSSGGLPFEKISERKRTPYTTAV